MSGRLAHRGFLLGAAAASTTILELLFEGSNGSTTFTETTGKTMTPRGGAIISTAEFHNGSSSGLFVSSGAISTPNHADLSLAAFDWLFHTWVFPTSFASDGEVAAHRYDASDPNNFWLWRLTTAAKMRFFSRNGGGVLTDILSNATLTLNAWNEISAFRIAGVAGLEVNGDSSITTTTNSTSAYPTIGSGVSLQIGAGDPSSGYFTGYLDNFSMEKS